MQDKTGEVEGWGGPKAARAAIDRAARAYIQRGAEV
jgi:hypothetical protein